MIKQFCDLCGLEVDYLCTMNLTTINYRSNERYKDTNFQVCESCLEEIRAECMPETIKESHEKINFIIDTFRNIKNKITT